MAEKNSNPLAVPMPIFSGEKYDIWSTKMKTHFLSQTLWNIVNDGIPISGKLSDLSKREQKQLNRSRRQNAEALFILQQAVDDNIFSKISGAMTAKDAWDALKAEFQGNPQSTAASDQDRENCNKYLPFYKAILKGDLESVQDFCQNNIYALEARISVNLDTALHVAVGTNKRNNIVEYLLTKVTQLSQENKEGNTILSVAAIVGNKEAAQMIMKEDKRRELFTAPNKSGRIPLIEAARHGQKEMVRYLMQFSHRYFTYATSTRFRDDSDVSLVKLLITAGFYDLALDFLKGYKSLATVPLSTGESLLSAIAGKPSAFPSGRRRNPKFWGYLDIDNPNQLLQRILERFVPSHLKEIRETKSMHPIVLELVRCLCKVITRDPDSDERISSILKRPLLLAAELGVCEVVKEIINAYPDAIWFTNEKNHNVLHLAVMNRQENVLHLIYEIGGRKHLLLRSQDVDKNNILHLAGKLAPENKLNVIAGAAFQMQRELQWYKEVENIVPADCKNEINYVGETPEVVFHKSHKKLVIEGEKWMKEAATSCIVAATVTATLVFQAAFSGTSGYDKLSVFMTFGFSDALSLFSSIAAAIIFMSIITARYKQDDFLETLPRKFILGVVIMFISITSMMVAFGTTVYQIFYEKKAYVMLGLVGVSACSLMLFFMASQFSLIWHLFIYTYRPGLFCRQAKVSSTK